MIGEKENQGYLFRANDVTKCWCPLSILHIAENYKSEFGESKRRLTKRYASIEEMSAINISNISKVRHLF